MSRTAVPAEAFDHGDPRRYRRGCRCRTCITAITKQVQRGNFLRATGRGLTTAPDRAADHLDALRAAGTSDSYTIQQSGICPDLLYRIARRHGTIHRRTESRLLAVKPAPTTKGPGNNVPALGTTRRLRALAADGWSAAELGRQAGKHKQFIVHLQGLPEQAQVRMWVADYVRELCQQLRDRAPESQGVPVVIASRTRKRAASKGWSGTDYWDDEDFDDPDFTPATTDTVTKRIDVTHLLSCGASIEDVMARTGASIAYVRDIAAELRNGKPRDRSRNKTTATDMRKAA